VSEATTLSRNRAQDPGPYCVPMGNNCDIGGYPCCGGGVCVQDLFDVYWYTKCVSQDPGAYCVPMGNACDISGYPCCKGGICYGDGDLFDLDLDHDGVTGVIKPRKCVPEATTLSRNRAQDPGADCVPMEKACKIGGTPCCEGGICDGQLFDEPGGDPEWLKCIPASWRPGPKSHNAGSKKASMAKQIHESKNLKELHLRREAAARFQRETKCQGTPCEGVSHRCCDSTCNIKPECAGSLYPLFKTGAKHMPHSDESLLA